MDDNGSPYQADPVAADATWGVGRDRPVAHSVVGAVSERSPGRALLAIAGSVVLISVLWTVRGAGALALILIPLMALYAINVYLGGGLNDSPLGGIERIRRWRVQR